MEKNGKHFQAFKTDVSHMTTESNKLIFFIEN